MHLRRESASLSLRGCPSVLLRVGLSIASNLDPFIKEPWGEKGHFARMSHALPPQRPARGWAQDKGWGCGCSLVMRGERKVVLALLTSSNSSLARYVSWCSSKVEAQPLAHRSPPPHPPSCHCAVGTS